MLDYCDLFSLQLSGMLLNNTKGQVTGNLTYQGTRGFARRRLLATSNIPNSPITGILNPTVCLTYGSLMMFSVTNEHYPIYDRFVKTLFSDISDYFFIAVYPSQLFRGVVIFFGQWIFS